MNTVQQVLQSLVPPTPGTVSGPQATDLHGSPSSHEDTGVRTLFQFLLSFSSSFGDWFTLAVLGAVIEFARRSWGNLWSWFIGSFFITANFDGDDDAYDWMLIWLSKKTSWSSSRELQVSIQNLNPNRRYIEDNTVATVGESDDVGSQRKLVYLPSFGSTHSVFYKHHYIRVTRDRQYIPEQGKTETLTVSILGRDHNILTNILKEAQALHREEESTRVSIYIADNYNNWRYSGSRPKRPWSSVILAPDVKETVLTDAEDFLSSERWYAERGIPYRRGYLLHGAPGSGKTSLIHALAGALKLDIYVISLSKRGMDDSQLHELICELPARAIALMEDIDAAFTHGISRDDEKRPASPPGSGLQDSRGITLSGLLGAIDGVAAQEGRILMATTNRYHVLDPALIRPGRLDIHVEFKLATSWQAGEIFKRFYLVSRGQHEPTAEKTVGRAKSDDEKVPLITNGSSNTFVTEANDHANGFPVRRSAFVLTLAQRDALAAEFAAAIPDYVTSMASIQGHLMLYKTRPSEAVRTAPAFVDGERAKAAARESMKKAEAKELAVTDKANVSQEGQP